MSEIKLNSILTIPPEEYSDWTICLNNAPKEGIYSFSTNHDRLMEHISWKKGHDRKMDFRRIGKYCLQFIRLDKDKKLNQWLFVGAFENFGVIPYEDGHELYDLRPIERFAQFREKLIIFYQKKQGPKQAKIPIKEIEEIRIVRISENEYFKETRPFPGFKHLSLPFTDLKEIISSNPDNWRELLSNANCIYVISDKSNGKLYVGSTYGYDGIWQRWSVYVETNGHGNDADLKKLLASDPDYAIKYFQFSVVECFFKEDKGDNKIIERESHWKGILLSKEFGYNNN